MISNSVLKEEDTPDIRRGKAKEDSPYLQSRHLLSTNKCMHGMRALGVPFQTCMDGSIRLSEMLGLIEASQPDRLFFFQNCTFFNWFSFIGETIVFYFAVKVRGNTLHSSMTQGFISFLDRGFGFKDKISILKVSLKIYFFQVKSQITNIF